MTQDEIIEMAKQAGALQISFNTFSMQHEYSMFPKELEAFAKLVAEKEREACANIADEWAVGWPHPSQVIAERIRERT